MNKKHWTILLSLILMVAIAGCGQKPQASGSSNVPSSTEPAESSASVEPSEASVSAEPSADDNVQTQTVNVYFSDADFTELKEFSREIKLTEQDNPVEKYKAAFEALQNNGDTGLVSLWEKVHMNSLTFKDGEITLDIHMPDEAKFGTDGELMALDSLKKTFFQFDEVKSIELLVDGTKRESLMGHADLDHPLTRE